MVFYCVHYCHMKTSMQKCGDSFSGACDNFGLTNSTKKTSIGNVLSKNARIDAEVASRLSKASSAFGRLRNRVWDISGIRTETKLRVYSAVVLPTLLYGAESWTVYRTHANKLNRFHLSCLRRILGIHWKDKIPDTEVLERAQSPSIYCFLKKIQQRWVGQYFTKRKALEGHRRTHE